MENKWISEQKAVQIKKFFIKILHQDKAQMELVNFSNEAGLQVSSHLP